MQSKNNYLEKDYGSLISTIKILSLAAQFISGATGGFGVYIVILEKLPIGIKILAIAITIILTLIIIGAFEGGIRKLYPYWIRQILNWCFDTKEEDSKPQKIRIVLFVMICIMLVPLVLGTTISSWKASPDLVSYSTDLPDVKDLTNVSEKLDSNTQNVIQTIETEIQRNESLFQSQQNGEQEKWRTKIYAQELKRKHYLKLYAEGHQWANGSAYEIKNQIIPSLKSQEKEAIQNLQQSQINKLDSLQTAKRTALLLAQNNKTKILASIQTTNDTNVQSHTISIQKWGNFLAILAIVSTFFTLFCLSFIEAYKAGITEMVSDTELHHSRQKNGVNYSTQNSKKINSSYVPLSITESVLVKPEHTHTVNHAIVSIDKLIKRTRMQWKRSQDTNRREVTRANNLEKAKVNIEFLQSLGVLVSVDEKDSNRLIIDKKEVG